MDIILKYFPYLSEKQKSRFFELKPLYEYWNARINVISRKDISQLYERHVLHSLGIAKIISFQDQTTILDVGSGGGFPGIPLAIMFPDCIFHLIDSIGKKVKVIEEIKNELQLTNVTTEQTRAENLIGKWDFIVSRAVTSLPSFTNWVKENIATKSKNELQNGIIYLKGGDIQSELAGLKMKSRIIPLSDFFEEDFFKSKAAIHLYR